LYIENDDCLFIRLFDSYYHYHAFGEIKIYIKRSSTLEGKMECTPCRKNSLAYDSDSYPSWSTAFFPTYSLWLELSPSITSFQVISLFIHWCSFQCWSPQS